MRVENRFRYLGRAAPSVIFSAGFHSNQANLSNLSSYTFTDVPIGNPSSNKWLVMFTSTSRSAESGSNNVANVTVDGVTANLFSREYLQVSSSHYEGVFNKILAPSGTTANIIVNAVATVLGCSLYMYSIVTPGSTLTEYDMTTAQSNALSTNTKSDGILIVGAMTFNQSTTTLANVDNQRANYDVPSGNDYTALGDVYPTGDVTSFYVNCSSWNVTTRMMSVSYG